MEEMLQPIMTIREMQVHLGSPIGIKNSPIYPIISNMNISYNEVQQVSHNLHNFCRQKGENEALKKVLDILRVNPLLALNTIKSCSLCKYTEHIYVMLKTLYYAVSYQDSIVILNNKVPFIILFIEALYFDDARKDISII